ncbi:uncharacterized protein EHS24_002392 [Apiotrichum porosum]|uniref:Uncharacterized protein n=1 Tax=Apiotrichum porosum TaxID=105984 RepID=A0A427XIN6_9TREE|nr:uncharacterized protein EHS24_002392 [Apiotrichum porosum]RSH78663.1 hypothetical protein EHS24_002392 [Apiotrichum porosum]
MSIRSFTTPLARATRASSSRVGLDFGIPAVAGPSRFVSTSASASSPVPTAPVNAVGSKRTAKGKAAAVLGPRWQPLDSLQYAGEKGMAPTHTLTVFSSRNNTVLTFTDKTGPLFPTITSGTDKVFKKSQRNSVEAAHQATLKMFARIQAVTTEWKTMQYQPKINIAYKGVGGKGREAVHLAILSNNGDEIRPLITRVEDRSPIKIGGTRARTARRV